MLDAAFQATDFSGCVPPGDFAREEMCDAAALLYPESRLVRRSAEALRADGGKNQSLGKEGKAGEAEFPCINLHLPKLVLAS